MSIQYWGYTLLNLKIISLLLVVAAIKKLKSVKTDKMLAKLMVAKALFIDFQGHDLTLDLQDIISIRKQKPTKMMH